MFQQLKEVLFGNIQRVSATFMIVGGVVIPLLLPESRMVTVISVIMAALGGGLLSVVQEQDMIGRKLFNPRIMPAARHLINSVNQLETIVLKVEREELGEYEGIQHATELLPSLRTVVADLYEITGEQLDPARHNATIATMCKLHAVGSENTHGNSISAETRAQGTVTREDVERTIETGGATNISTDMSVLCPFCGTKQKIAIGVQPASSASPTCKSCALRFHAHRNQDLTVFTKRPGTKMGEVLVTCDKIECHYSFMSKLPAPGKTAERFCIKCGRLLEINSDGRVIKSADVPAVASAGTREEHDRKCLFCSEHNYRAVSFYETPEACYAACYGDMKKKHLIKLSTHKSVI